MTRSQQIPIEVSPDEIGDRLSAVRLLPVVDQEMAASLRRYGQLAPLVVFRDDKGGGGLEVIDGFRRQQAAMAHGFPPRIGADAGRG
jgi:ParB-like chromosome segregation protein Spo0J